MEFIVNARDIRVQVSDVISVQEDNETQTIDFRINKTEHEYDLASLHPYVLFKPYRANGVDFCIVEKKIDGDSIVLTWLINRAVTFAEGELQFQIVFSDSLDPAADKGTKRWATKIAKVKIPESLLGNKFVLPESQILSQLIALADRVQNGAAATKESETAAAASAKSAADNAIKTGTDKTAAENAAKSAGEAMKVAGISAAGAKESETAAAESVKSAADNATKTEQDKAAAEKAAAAAEAAKKSAADSAGEAKESETAAASSQKSAADNAVKTTKDQVATEAAAKRAEAAKTELETAKNAAAGSANTATQQAQTAQLEAEKVQKIVAGNEAYTKTESDLKYTVAPRKEASSSTGELKLTDADDGLSYLELQGNSEQYTNTANKNLIDLHFATDGYYVNNVNGALAVNPNYKASGYINVIPGESYFLTNASQASPGAMYNANKVYVQGVVNGLNVIPEGVKYVRISSNKAIQTEASTQFEKGTQGTEIVIGAVDTPAPDYPSEVRSVGDIPKDVNGVEIRNLLDEVLEDLLIYEDSKDFIYLKLSSNVITGNYAVWSKKTPVSNGLYCRFSKTIIGWGDAGSIQIVEQGVYNGTEGTSYPFNFINSSDLYITFTHASTSGNKKPSKEMIKAFFETYNIMVTPATEIDEYRPYIGENNGLVKLESTGINHVDVNNVLKNMQTITTVNEDGSRIKSIQDSVNGTSRYVVYFNYKKNTQYSLYCKCWYEGETGQGASLIQIRDAGGASGPIQQTFAQNVKSDLFHTFNTGDNSNLSVWIYVQSVGGQPKRTMYVEDLMIVEGEKTLQEMKALKYQPYHQQITWIPLREPLQGLYGVKDTVDKNGYVTKKFDSIETRLDICIGKSGWNERAFAMYTVNESTKNFVNGGFAYSEVAYLSKEATAGKPVMITTQGFNEKNGWYFGFWFLYGYLGLSKTSTDAENKQKILGGLGTGYKIKAWYQLKEPITYQIPAVYIETYDQETNVRCLNKIKPSDMTLDYKIAMSNLIKRLEALEAKTVQEV